MGHHDSYTVRRPSVLTAFAHRYLPFYGWLLASRYEARAHAEVQLKRAKDAQDQLDAMKSLAFAKLKSDRRKRADAARRGARNARHKQFVNDPLVNVMRGQS